MFTFNGIILFDTLILMTFDLALGIKVTSDFKAMNGKKKFMSKFLLFSVRLASWPVKFVHRMND